MAKEFVNLQFVNNAQGQTEKIQALQTYGAQGWRVSSETITPGKFNGTNSASFTQRLSPDNLPPKGR
ncbi:MAG: hypothetical protein WA902_16015 [Thermosynechococcaceae cyanobacterium]